jgi:hypothetical protein
MKRFGDAKSSWLDSELASHIKGRLPHLEGKVWGSLLKIKEQALLQKGVLVSKSLFPHVKGRRG